MTESDFTRRVMAMRHQLYHVGRALLWNDEDAADAVQDAMLLAWKKRRSLRDEAKFEAWFMRIFINRCRDVQRREIRRRAIMAETVPPAALSPGNTDVSLALNALPDALRLPVILFYVEGYSQGEAAQMLGITREQVNTRLRQARKRMKRMLSEGGCDDEGPEG